jgi:hypothetical protein
MSIATATDEAPARENEAFSKVDSKPHDMSPIKAPPCVIQVTRRRRALRSEVGQGYTEFVVPADGVLGACSTGVSSRGPAAGASSGGGWP